MTELPEANGRISSSPLLLAQAQCYYTFCNYFFLLCWSLFFYNFALMFLYQCMVIICISSKLLKKKKIFPYILSHSVDKLQTRPHITTRIFVEAENEACESVAERWPPLEGVFFYVNEHKLGNTTNLAIRRPDPATLLSGYKFVSRGLAL